MTSHDIRVKIPEKGSMSDMPHIKLINKMLEASSEKKQAAEWVFF